MQVAVVDLCIARVLETDRRFGRDIVRADTAGEKSTVTLVCALLARMNYIDYNDDNTMIIRFRKVIHEEDLCTPNFQLINCLDISLTFQNSI